MDAGFADTQREPAARAEERRRVQRHPYTDPVRLRNGVVLDGDGCDVSEGGVGVLLAAPVHPGTAVDVIFIGNEVFVEGVVRHSRPVEGGYRVGVAFLQPEPELVEVLHLTRHAAPGA